MLFSVIVPVYNISEEFLRKCLDSLVAQSCMDVEFIIINDGSTNGCEKTIEEYRDKDSRFVYLPQVNQGVSAARNNGLKNAKGDYIVFVDGDDWVSSSLFETLKKLVTDTQDEMIFYKYVKASVQKENTVSSRDIVKHSLSQNERKKWLLSDVKQTNLIEGIEIGSPWGKVISKAFLDSNNISYPLNIPRAQDRVFISWCLEKATRISYIDYEGYTYNDINDTSATKKYNSKIVAVLEMAGNHLISVVNRCDYLTEEEKKEAITEQYLRFMTEWEFLFFLHKDMKLSRSEQIEEMKKVYDSQTFSFIRQNKALHGEVLKSLKFGKKYDIIMKLLEKQHYGILYLFGVLYRTILM